MILKSLNFEESVDATSCDTIRILWCKNTRFTHPKSQMKFNYGK